jgi:glycosidase
MKIVLDGVFNHMGRRSSTFQDALKNPKSSFRDWYYIDDSFKNGYKGWIGGTNMPVNRVESQSMANYLWNAPDSVVQGFLKRGIDGWRLDVAYELGTEILAEITKSSHKAKKGSLVVGEMLGYPAGWSPQVDGQYNLFATSVCKDMLNGEVSGSQAGLLLSDWISDAGIDHALKSWLIADNHDMDRLASVFADDKDRFLMLAMLLALPGSPNIYYGSELGMVGKGDPENRAPMRWDLVSDTNKTLTWIRQLLAIRKSNPALKYGDFTALRSEKLLAFTRTTGKLRDNVIVLVNPTAKSVKETFSHRIGNLMSWQSMEDVITKKKVVQKSGLLTAEVPAKSVQILVPVIDRTNGFSPYDRIK